MGFGEDAFASCGELRISRATRAQVLRDGGRAPLDGVLESGQRGQEPDWLAWPLPFHDPMTICGAKIVSDA